MVEQEKVIERLGKLSLYFKSMLQIGYRGDTDIYKEHRETAKMALDLLKEQEQAMPTWSQGKAYCGNCGQRLPRKRADRKINYCGYCGQAVKWNE